MTKFYVIDSIMGNGKTSAMQHLMLNADLFRDRYVVVVPLLTEIQRWKTAFENCNFHTVTPEQGQKNKTKTSDLKELLRHRAKMIIITHSMFDRFDDEITELLREGEYTLIIDEVPIPVRCIDIEKDDLSMLIRANTILIDPETNRVAWNTDYLSSQSIFAEIQDLCATNTVFYNPRTKAIYRISPYSIYFACKAVYILTYMFEAQIIYYYLRQRNVEYKKFNVFYDEEAGCYELADDNDCFNKRHDWKTLINICDNKRMNAIGDKRNALSMNWFEDNSAKIKTLKKNVFNFSRNICKAKADDVLWTTYMDYRSKVEANGFKKGFLAVNAKATNDFSTRTVVSYIANRFASPDIKNYFNLADDSVKFNEDAYALSEMLQFIWRSAIRTGQPINLYVPSSRMRGLLVKWIEENSVQHAV